MVSKFDQSFEGFFSLTCSFEFFFIFIFQKLVLSKNKITKYKFFFSQIVYEIKRTMTQKLE